jgi:hypothetical protein
LDLASAVKKVTAVAGTPAIAVLKGVKERFPHKKNSAFSVSFFTLDAL